MNTNTQHTPGPWRADDGQIYGPNPEFDPTDPQTHEEILIADTAPDNAALTEYDEANAHLIASSPALLDALKSAVSYLEANRPKGKISEIFHQLNEYENGVLKPARAAIAQAEGGAK